MPFYFRLLFSEVEPWTFDQHLGVAIIIPAGCPYQIRNLKSCVNVVLDFLSRENVSQCIHLIEEFCLLPENHNAKLDKLEVKRMSILGVSSALNEIHKLTSMTRSHLDLIASNMSSTLHLLAGSYSISLPECMELKDKR